ncbi:DUF362 domain-containing protein [Acidobacteriota bacterium]
MSRATVSIVKTNPKPEYEEIKKAVSNALDLIGGIQDIVQPGNLVLINPSWVAAPVEREAGCITLPEIPRAIADIVKEMGARAVIAESSAVGVDTEKVIKDYEQLRELGYEILNLKKTPKVNLPVENSRVFDSVECWELVQQADVIVSVPKLKTHDQTEMTCSIKNLKGLLSDNGKREMHLQGLFEGVVDLMSALKPKLAVVDATICQEGLGPIFGKPVEMNLILASKDLVAVDSTCARLIGYDPSETLLTVNAAARGLGVIDSDKIEITGVPLDSVKRRFLRSVEDDPVQVENFRMIHTEATCTGCRNTVMSALIDMRNADQLMYLPGVTVVTSDAPIPGDVTRDSIVTVGKCIPEASQTERHVLGCPPNNALIVKAIIGDRAEVKRMYADESLDKTEK